MKRTEIKNHLDVLYEVIDRSYVADKARRELSESNMGEETWTDRGIDRHQYYPPLAPYSGRDRTDRIPLFPGQRNSYYTGRCDVHWARSLFEKEQQFRQDLLEYVWGLHKQRQMGESRDIGYEK